MPMPVRYSRSSSKQARRSFSHLFQSLDLRSLLLFFSSAILLPGCNSSGHTIVVPPAPTSVTVLLSSTANDQLTQFEFTVLNITLTNKTGSMVTLFTNPLSGGPAHFVEFMRLNANSEPLVTLNVPQDVYTSATVTFANPGFVLVTVDPTGALTTHTDSDSSGTESATVNLASPITVSGTAMGLLLDLQVSPSETFTAGPNGDIYTIAPILNLTPVAISSHPANDQNGQETGIDGMVASVNAPGNSFSIQTADHVALSIQTNGSTVYQGISAFSALTAGMFINMDAAIQSSGSLAATRIEVADTTAVDVLMGKLLDLGPSPSVANATIIDVFGAQQQGADFAASPAFFQRYQLAANTNFRTSGQFSNVTSLPFLASFASSNLVAGQNIYVSSPAISFLAIPTTIATTVTLMPQTINGMVTSLSGSGNFQIYTVALAPNDLLTTLDSTTNVVVYVDSNTQSLNTSPIAVGSLLRFNGLLFNDNGTFRMDCAQVNDGVTE
jgi:hypothetical protein